MGLLHEIQESVIKEESSLASIFLKLRLLAAKLGSPPLEEWIKHEYEGYPPDSKIPSYRATNVTYTGTFYGPFGSGISNVQIPSHLIEKFAGKQWTRYEIRDGIAAIDELVRSSANGDGTLGIDASNLILLLQGKVYPDYSCNDVRGVISRSALTELRSAVRKRILDLTLEFEKSIPASTEIMLGGSAPSPKVNSDQVNQISQNIIYGNVTNISSRGAGTRINIALVERNDDAFIEYLIKSGIPQGDASELVQIVSSETPTSAEEPFGAKAKEWLVKNLRKAADGTWKIGISVATKVLTEAVLKYYGLK
jgi:hypothetical protein